MFQQFKFPRYPLEGDSNIKIFIENEPPVKSDQIYWLVNTIRPTLREINARQFKMTTILVRFNALIPYFMTFSFQVLCIISEEIGIDRVSLVLLCSCSSRALPATQNPIYCFCSCNRLNSSS